MAFVQSVEACLEAGIGEGGLSPLAFESYLDRLKPRMHKLHEEYESGSLPILRVAERRDDIPPMVEAFQRLAQGAKTIVFFGTGGSSLGGQTIAQYGGWSIPGDNGDRNGPNPRTRFYDNLDARTLELSLARLDLETTRFILISKSGGTPETLTQAIAAMERVRTHGLEEKMPELFLGLTEPAMPGKTNGLRDLCEAYGIPVLDHDTGIGGRFSALTNTGLLAALARDIDPVKIREGAASVIAAMMADGEPADFAPAIGAAVQIGLAKEKGIKASVLMPYSDRLGRFAAWFVQLWGESLGKDGKGTTPVAALGPVDQHSQLQLYLDGAPQHLITVLRPGGAGAGPRIAPDLAKLANADYLAGKCAGDLVAAQQKAIPQALIDAGRAVRTMDIETLDAETLGALMMHFMLETILSAHLLGVDPFDQPAVEAGKILTRQYLGA
ncbi:glucose-6-phosphate isomerase [Methyloligella sp. 2.7D]|uniref:glucose-6-phosphate isomerase n=1 Tax=unclassified Methyloligella TaxID=2625955 RepID=UPI00157CAC25|nr:glucose-6-phosphate isomerase [Methyloligella sp. GL2]QKP78351.1 glucose-6-phosphate isomerase [Methyloligella sp. GL2]